MKTQIFATLISFTVTVLVCPVLLPILKKLKFGQAERALGPESHFKKAGTPTIGGISFIAGMIASCAVLGLTRSFDLVFALVISLLFGLIGFLDDYMKIIQKNALTDTKNLSSASLGMRGRHKIVMQFSVAAALAVYAAYHPNIGTDVLIPFLSINWDMGLLFIPFVIFAAVAVVNASNLTDGLDGLAAGVAMIIMVFFLIFSGAKGYSEISILSASTIGGCMGFICYNFNPAKVFMGDTGSMALGGAVIVCSVLTKTEFFILIAGAIYVIEALSDIIQVAYFKATHGKRFFKMAPIHHHFELSGWPETRVVIVFWTFTAVCVMLSVLAAGLNIY
ncbi:MAG: phospho-N-acetylmuramoyl-pentapeptide-transferase [Eubacteriaceae bacterium]|nr:phospho-N-acetylmuramoyl-pentapeptide-transferase [Eubacteriaceae bacterium]MBR5995079.1 phospho-N-acetylmuramoyl-pentapeptide-transferase [Eubacteriaceae bacterium]